MLLVTVEVAVGLNDPTRCLFVGHLVFEKLAVLAADVRRRVVGKDGRSPCTHELDCPALRSSGPASLLGAPSSDPRMPVRHTAQAGTAPVMAAIVMIGVTAAMLVWAFDMARHSQSTSSFVPDDAGFSITSARSSGSADAAVTARAPDGRRDPVPSALSIPQEPPPNCENRY